jgi:hypothetical protein
MIAQITRMWALGHTYFSTDKLLAPPMQGRLQAQLGEDFEEEVSRQLVSVASSQPCSLTFDFITMNHQL